MPVLKEWYEVDSVLGRKIKCGIPHYLIKWKNYRTMSWEPYYNIGTDLISAFEDDRRDRQVKARFERWQKRAIKRELDLAYEESIPIPGRPPKVRKKR